MEEEEGETARIWAETSPKSNKRVRNVSIHLNTPVLSGSELCRLNYTFKLYPGGRSSKPLVLRQVGGEGVWGRISESTLPMPRLGDSFLFLFRELFV